MRKILATLALLAGALYTLSAVPAYPGKVRVTQPDGSVVILQGHGDEWYHYVTNEAGQVVARDADGFYRPAEKPSKEQLEASRQMRRAANQMRAQAQAQASSLTQGHHKIPVLLVSFTDIDFKISRPAASFSNMLNQEGYSARGGTGSVRDYYLENSHGAYDPEFEVFGPVTLSHESLYYAGTGGMANVAEAVQEACSLLDDEIDFSQYDSDSDGRVDMLLMYYAGYNQAESHREGEIWPHQSNAYNRNVKFDGKHLDRYFCTSELKGSAGSTMCGIGTTTHEFGHSLGLPDFYDTDYEENGSAGALYQFSLMCSGSYNNDGRTPPYLNSEERRMLGWMDDQTVIPGQGSLTIEPVQDNVAYKTYTTMDGEYFVYECRTQTGWDRYIPCGGLLVYHVDKAERATLNPNSWWPNYYTPAMLWDQWAYTNAINAFGDHPCFYLIPAADQTNLNYDSYIAHNIPFPGNKKVTKYTPLDWQGEKGDFRFTDISFDGSKVTMTARLLTVAGVQGVVRNSAARPLRGATVSIYRNSAAAAPARSQGRMHSRVQALGTPVMSVTTDVDGNYVLEDASLADGSFTLVVTCDGYVEAESSIEIARRMETRDFYLLKVGESTENTFIKYDPEGSFNPIGYGDASKNWAAALRLTVEEASAYAGKQIKLISFQPYGTESSTVESAYVFIEAGGKRIFTQKVDNVRFDAMNTVSVVSQEFLIPEKTDLYIGYGLVGCNEPYPLLVQPCEEEKAGYLAEFKQNVANSWTLLLDAEGNYYTPVITASVGEPVEASLGFNHIANPGNGTYKAGDRFELSLVRYEDDAPSTVAWKFDGQTVKADSVSLTAGSHTVEAHLTYPDGSVEVIRLVINAE